MRLWPPQIWAYVIGNADGTVVASKGISGVTRPGPGEYILTMPYNGPPSPNDFFLSVMPRLGSPDGRILSAVDMDLFPTEMTFRFIIRTDTANRSDTDYTAIVSRAGF